jgi:rhomboid protease GluP
MAAGFPPKYIKQDTFQGLSPREFLALSLEVFKELDWKISFLSPSSAVAHTSFSVTSWSEEVKLLVEGDKYVLRSQCIGSQAFDLGKNRRNTEKFASLLAELQGKFSPEELDVRYQALIPAMAPDPDPALQPAPRSGLNAFLSIFVPSRGYWVTPIITNLNIGVFLIMVISGVSFTSPSVQSLLDWGANIKALTLGGEPWRLFTCIFLHIGVLHLLMNMYALVYIGLLLEPILGSKRFAVAYLVTGMAASLTSLAWHDTIVSAGASGAIFGMYGVFLALLTTNLIEKTARQSLLTSIGIFVVYNLMNGMNGAVDNAAHIGGLVSGLLCGYAFIPVLRRPDAKALSGIISSVLVILIAIATFVCYTQLPNDYATFQKKMDVFMENQKQGLAFIKLEKASDADILKNLKEQSLPAWKRNVSLLDEMEKLKVPEAMQERNLKLYRYCKLRIELDELLIKGLENNTHEYQADVERCAKEIETLLKELNEK